MVSNDTGTGTKQRHQGEPLQKVLKEIQSHFPLPRWVVRLRFGHTLVASCCGCTRRFFWEVKYVGCTPMLLMTLFQGLWTVAYILYHMFRGAATAPATVAQKGTPFDFEVVELTKEGLSETLTRSPPPPYNPSFRQRVADWWRKWNCVPAEDWEPMESKNNSTPTAPSSPNPSTVVHSPKTVRLTTNNELQLTEVPFES